MTHDRPELTTIPADAYWPKNGEVETPSYGSYEHRGTIAAADADAACYESTAIPELIKLRFAPILGHEFPWEQDEICCLWDGHNGAHMSGFGTPEDQEHGRTFFWMLWGGPEGTVVRHIPFCGHTDCNHPSDFYCLGCRMPKGHEGRHTGKE